MATFFLLTLLVTLNIHGVICDRNRKSLVIAADDVNSQEIDQEDKELIVEGTFLLQCTMAFDTELDERMREASAGKNMFAK